MITLESGSLVVKHHSLASIAFIVGQYTLLLTRHVDLTHAFTYALKDASIPPSNVTPVEDIGEWIILRRSVKQIVMEKMTWGDASAKCDIDYFRLATLETLEKAQALVAKIKAKSVPYSSAYDKKYREIEYGMDRRYWIGLTDQIEENKWAWTHNGGPLEYDFWYPGQPDHKDANTTKSKEIRLAKDKEHCVSLWNPGYYMNDTHTFNDEPCMNLYYAICEKPQAPPALTRSRPPPIESSSKVQCKKKDAKGRCPRPGVKADTS